MLFYDPLLCLENFCNGYAFEGVGKVEWHSAFWGNHLFPLPLEGCHLLPVTPHLLIWETKAVPMRAEECKGLFFRKGVYLPWSAIRVSEPIFLHTHLYSLCPTCSIGRCCWCKRDDKHTIHGRLIKANLFLSIAS